MAQNLNVDSLQIQSSPHISAKYDYDYTNDVLEYIANLQGMF